MKTSARSPYSLMSEKQLAELVSAGQNEAFDEVCRRHRLKLYQMALAILSSSAKAEKSVSQALALARNELHEYQGESLLLTWLYRRLQKYILNHCLVPELPEPPDSQVEPDPE